MKCLLVLCLMTVVAVSMGAPDTPSRGCIYVNGRCFKQCEEGTHSYSTGCDYLIPEATCDKPHPVPDKRGKLCDFSACYCDPPAVRDTESNKCVPLDQCPKKKEECS